MKKNYIKPVSELIAMKSEGLMTINSIDNTGLDGADGEKQTGIHEMMMLDLMPVPRTTTCGTTAITFGNDSRNNRHKTAA